MSEFKTLYVTCADKNEAQKIARNLVKNGLAACGNVLDGATSIYQWEGDICEDSEAILILKTRSEIAKEAIEAIKKYHSYDVPCICQWDIEDGNNDYLDWIRENTMAK